MDRPSPNGSNGTRQARDAQGRFAPGNPGGPGNPYARRVARLRQRFLEVLESEDAIERLVKTLVAKASAGDVAAAKLVLAYTLGPPKDPEDDSTVRVPPSLALWPHAILSRSATASLASGG